MKEFSKEVINIDGVDYTLFLNRKGIITWEKLTKATSKANEIEKKYRNLGETSEEEIEIKDGDNPFELVGEDSLEIEKDEQELINLYIKLYWIMLYEEHKLNLKDVEELWNKAVSEYGSDALIQLGIQMIEEANTNKQSNNLKKLDALKPKKN